MDIMDIDVVNQSAGTVPHVNISGTQPWFVNRRFTCFNINSVICQFNIVLYSTVHCQQASPATVGMVVLDTVAL